MKEEVTRKICLKCGHEFTYKERLQSSYRLFWRMYCKNCGTRYSVLIRYRLIFSMLLAVPILFGLDFYEYMGWGVWNVLIFIASYFTLLALLTIYVVPILPLKWEPTAAEENPQAKDE